MRHRLSPAAPGAVAEVLVATTWRCNLRCSYCFLEQARLGGEGDRMSPDLAAEVVEAVDRALGDVDSICLHLYGGEPLTNLPALRAMVERAEEGPAGRFGFAVTTNGTCGTPEALELLDRGGFQVILSIDGPPEVHDGCRRTAGGRGTHRRVLRFLHDLREHTRCTVRGSAVVRSGWSLADAVGYLESLPVDRIKAQAVRGPADLPWGLGPAERTAYLQDLEEIGRRVADELEAGRAPRDDRFNHRVLQLLAGMEREAFCAAGDTTFGITPDGEILPCILLDPGGHRLGRVGEEPGRWRAAGRRWRRAGGRRPECSDCPALPLCGGGCPAVMPVCGAGECELIRKNCEVAGAIHRRFADRPETLLTLAGA